MYNAKNCDIFLSIIGFCASSLEKMQFDATVKKSVDSWKYPPFGLLLRELSTDFFVGGAAPCRSPPSAVPSVTRSARQSPRQAHGSAKDGRIDWAIRINGIESVCPQRIGECHLRDRWFFRFCLCVYGESFIINDLQKRRMVRIWLKMGHHSFCNFSVEVTPSGFFASVVRGWFPRI